MVKERKAQHGVTNISARSLESNTESKASTDANSAAIMYARGWTDTLLAPDAYEKEGPSVKRIKKHITATWRPAEVYQRDFQTTHKGELKGLQSYIDEDYREPPKPKSLEEIAREEATKRAQVNAIDNMCKLVRVSYGTVGSMIRSFHKKPSDEISIFELEKYLERNKLANYLPEEERKLIFDSINPRHGGKVIVKDFLKKVEEREFIGNEHGKADDHIRNFLEFHVTQKRLEKGVPHELASPTVPRLTASVSVNSKAFTNDSSKTVETFGIDDVGEEMKRVLGISTFGLDVDHEEFAEVVEEVFHTLPTTEAHRKYARFLHHSHIKPANVPFYSMRKENLEKLKFREKMIDDQLSSEGPLLTRLKQLAEKKAKGSGTTIDPEKWTKLLAEKESNQRLSSSLSLPNLSSPLEYNTNKESLIEPNQSSSPKLSRSKSHADKLESLPPRRPTPNKKVRNLLADSSKGKDFDENATVDTNDTMSTFSSPSKVNKVLKTTIPDIKADERDFYTHVVEPTSSMGYLKDSSSILRIEKIDPLAMSPGGKRTVNSGPMDWSRVGVGGDHDVGYGDNPLIDDRFLTTSNKFFQPIIYNSSQPPMRAVVSDAELDWKKREYRRKERFARTKANMDATITRLEFDRLDKEVRQLRGAENRVEDAIRYNTNFLLSDLRSFKQQPLQRMSKRQNVQLAEKMWGGATEKQTVKIIPENRDFTTTYRQSFIFGKSGSTSGSLAAEH